MKLGTGQGSNEMGFDASSSPASNNLRYSNKRLLVNGRFSLEPLCRDWASATAPKLSFR